MTSTTRDLGRLVDPFADLLAKRCIERGHEKGNGDLTVLFKTLDLETQSKNKAKQSSRLPKLAPELMLKILDHLGPVAKVCLSLTCKDLMGAYDMSPAPIPSVAFHRTNHIQCFAVNSFLGLVAPPRVLAAHNAAILNFAAASSADAARYAALRIAQTSATAHRFAVEDDDADGDDDDESLTLALAPAGHYVYDSGGDENENEDEDEGDNDDGGSSGGEYDDGSSGSDDDNDDHDPQAPAASVLTNPSQSTTA